MLGRPGPAPGERTDVLNLEERAVARPVHLGVTPMGRGREREAPFLSGEWPTDPAGAVCLRKALTSDISVATLPQHDRGSGADRLGQGWDRWVWISGGPWVEPAAFVAGAERLHDSLDVLPGGRAAGEGLHGDSLLELECRAVVATVDVHGHGLLHRRLRLSAPESVAPQVPGRFEAVVEVREVVGPHRRPHLAADVELGVGEHALGELAQTADRFEAGRCLSDRPSVHSGWRQPSDDPRRRD